MNTSHHCNTVSLTNIHDGIYNNLFLIKNNNAVNIWDTFALKSDITNITGLAPDTLNTLSELAEAIGNDPIFFQYVRDQLILKRNIFDSYDKTYVNTLISLYYTKLEVNTLLDQKLFSSVLNDY